jgi:hypothetical protein
MTPLTPLVEYPDETPSIAGGLNALMPMANDATSQSVQLRAPPMTLDSYLAQHTSEDNASFSKIVCEEQEKKKVKVSVGH